MHLPECVNSVSGVPGLYIWEGFLSVEEESAILQGIEAQPWSGQGTPPNPEIRRRTQQYGHLFLFRTRKIAKQLGPLPSFVDVALERMIATQLFPQPPDLLIINEYETGQGIMPHIDAPTFGPVVTSLSLLSACVMSFALKQDVDERGSKTHVDVLLRPRSLLIMTGPARYAYTHGISKNDVDLYEGSTIPRSRRVSLTFRTVVHETAE